MHTRTFWLIASGRLVQARSLALSAHASTSRSSFGASLVYQMPLFGPDTLSLSLRGRDWRGVPGVQENGLFVWPLVQHVSWRTAGPLGHDRKIFIFRPKADGLVVCSSARTRRPVHALPDRVRRVQCAHDRSPTSGMLPIGPAEANTRAAQWDSSLVAQRKTSYFFGIKTAPDVVQPKFARTSV
ncbi:hypothetical protein F4808DRAFT_390531 [Astrocystis sublimbata]|nr:hypothetical protein F4808DRAFT_390531 [Astrocystis sublimbata]